MWHAVPYLNWNHLVRQLMPACVRNYNLQVLDFGAVWPCPITLLVLIPQFFLLLPPVFHFLIYLILHFRLGYRKPSDSNARRRRARRFFQSVSANNNPFDREVLVPRRAASYELNVPSDLSSDGLLWECVDAPFMPPPNKKEKDLKKPKDSAKYVELLYSFV